MSPKIATFIAVLALPVCSSAGLVSQSSVVKLEQRADLIAVATLKSAVQDRTQARFSLQIDRALKGVATPGSIIDVESGYPLRLGDPPAPDPVRGMWFLTRASSGAWRLLPAREGDVTLSDTAFRVLTTRPAGAFAYADADNVLDKITDELAATVEAGRGRDALDAFLTGLQDINGTNPAVTRATSRFTNSPEPSLHIVGICAKIRRGDASALALLAAESDTTLRNAAPPRSLLAQHLTASIEIFYRNPDPSGVAALGKLSQTDYNAPYMQQAAVSALSAIHTKEALPFLLPLLDHSDPPIRFSAVFGFARFANNLPIGTTQNIADMGFTRSAGPGAFTTSETKQNMPSVFEFQQNESAYVTFWKTWYAANRGAIGAQ